MKQSDKIFIAGHRVMVGRAMVIGMVQTDLELFKRDVYLKKGGHKILHEQE